MPSIIVGVVACALGFWGLSIWLWSVAEFLRGAVPIALILFGLVAIGGGLRVKRSHDEKEQNE
ncbi:MAG: hypothetical protein HQM13_21895 [SAR324 cluster bacterium]|nr:hypothetical protein [SAR324 cluster bacterium]